MRFDRLIYRLGEALGYFFCELACKTDCRGPFQHSYRLGCWLYGQATDAGIRCGQLTRNPAFGRGTGEPFYIPRSR
jgi:hypothetical protein